MANTFLLARPYAKAIFKIAKEDKNYDRWSNALYLLASVTQNKKVLVILDDETVSSTEKAGLIYNIVKNHIDDDMKNLIYMLADNDRLKVFREIEILYNKYKNRFLKVIDVDVYSAIEMNDKQKKEYVTILTKYFQSDVNVFFFVDNSLIGGLKIQAEDIVLDYSLKTKILKLKESLLEEE